MACRKAAYNALTEMSEYMEKQQEHAAAAKAKLEAEMKKKWTPSNILDQCCIPWLADGSEVVGHRTNHHVTKGCSGGCGKDHPRITLNFISKSNKKDALATTEGAVATLSHPLDPFVKYFEELCQQNLATKIESKSSSDSPVRYSLKGFLQKHVEDLLKSDRFGYHLVKVSPTALASSKRAHERMAEEEEELERMAKRAKMDSEKKGSNDLFEQVLQVCYNHGALLDHLDILEISWMRLSGNKTMSKIAAKLAAERLRKTDLYFSTRMKCEEVDGHIYCVRPEEQYQVFKDKIPLKSSEKLGEFVPKRSDQKLFWNRLVSQEQASPELTKRCIEVTLHIGTPSNAIFQDLFYMNGIKHGLTVGEYNFDILGLSVEEEPESSCEAPSQQTPCSKLSLTLSTGPSSWISLQEDPDSLDFFPVELTGGKCTISQLTVGFEFQHLLGVYARKKLPIAKEQMAEIKRKRPVTRAEKEYVKAIAKAVREAPGSGERTFEGVHGW